MGRESKLRAMGDTEIMERLRDLYETIAGPVVRFGCYDGGCPKCGAPRSLHAKVLHSGYTELNPQDQCGVRDEHLHGKCQACGFEWREQVNDAEAEERRIPCSQTGDSALGHGALVVLPVVEA